MSSVIGKIGRLVTNHAMVENNIGQEKSKHLLKMEASFAKEMLKKFKSVTPSRAQVKYHHFKYVIASAKFRIEIKLRYKKVNNNFIHFLVSCEWNTWHEWEQCSKSCGGGITSRTRNIKQYAQLGGQECVGDAFQTKECNKQDCPSKL